MTGLPNLEGFPNHIVEMVCLAHNAGGAVMAFGPHDELLWANPEQQRIMPVSDYEPLQTTYDSIFWGAYNQGYSGNQDSRHDPAGWLAMAKRARIESDELNFLNRYPWGRAACSHVRLQDGRSLQVRVGLKASGLDQYLGTQEGGFGVVWALRIQEEMRRLRSALDSLGLAVAIVNRRGSVVYQNASFADLVGGADGLISAGNGILVATDAIDDIVMQQALAHVLAGSVPVLYVPLRRPVGTPLVMAVSAGETAGTAVVTVSRFGEDSKEIASTLRQALGLSPAEAEVMAALGAGRSVEEVADERLVAPNTVYQQVRSVKSTLKRSKFAVASPAGLVGLVQRLSAIHRAKTRIH